MRCLTIVDHDFRREDSTIGVDALHEEKNAASASLSTHRGREFSSLVSFSCDGNTVANYFWHGHVHVRQCQDQWCVRAISWIPKLDAIDRLRSRKWQWRYRSFSGGTSQLSLSSPYLSVPISDKISCGGKNDNTHMSKTCLGFVFPSRFHRLKNATEVKMAGGRKASAPKRGLPILTMQSLSVSKSNWDGDAPSDESFCTKHPQFRGISMVRYTLYTVSACCSLVREVRPSVTGTNAGGDEEGSLSRATRTGSSPRCLDLSPKVPEPLE